MGPDRGCGCTGGGEWGKGPFGYGGEGRREAGGGGRVIRGALRANEAWSGMSGSVPERLWKGAVRDGAWRRTGLPLRPERALSSV